MPMASASKPSITCQTNSIEELFNRIKTTSAAASADAICSGLSQVTRLYKCMEDLLTSSTTQVLMSCEQNKKWVDELVDESVRFLDICGSMSDMLSEIKSHSENVLCALKRRRKGELRVESSIKKYICFRKKMKKDVRGLSQSLKKVDNVITGGLLVVDSVNYQLAVVINAVVGVYKVTILVFESLLMLICAPVSKANRWSLVVPKLMHKGIVACEDQQENVVGNEFERTDVALRILSKYGVVSEMGNVQSAQCRLGRLGAQIEILESGLDCICKCLIRNRVSLLNIISL